MVQENVEGPWNLATQSSAYKQLDVVGYHLINLETIRFVASSPVSATLSIEDSNVSTRNHYITS